MPDLKQTFFANPAELSSAQIQTLSSTSQGLGLRDTLTAMGWQGNPIGTICLHLSPDGTRAASGRFGLWGVLSIDQIEFQASKLWENTPRGLTVRISDMQGQQFQFNNGQLQSDYTDGDSFNITVTKGGQEIPSAEWAANGIGNMSLRAFAHLDKSSNRLNNPLLKVTVLAVPLSADELAALSDRTQHPAWPGLRILECQANLFPSADSQSWGCPILPLLLTGARGATTNAVPSAAHLRFAIAEIMRSAALPTACASRGSLHDKGQEALDSDEDPEVRRPTITWTATQRQGTDRGKFLLNLTEQSQTRHNARSKTYCQQRHPIISTD